MKKTNLNVTRAQIIKAAAIELSKWDEAYETYLMKELKYTKGRVAARKRGLENLVFDKPIIE